MKFYTNVALIKDKIYLRGFENSQKIQKVIKYKPYFYINSNKESNIKSIEGKSLERVDFNNVWEARNFYHEYKNLEGFDIYGNEKFLYAFIYDNYKGEIEYDASLISKVILDIETLVGESGFPDIQDAANEITAISLLKDGKVYSLGTKPWTPEEEYVTYIQCRDETELLHKFIQLWKHLDPSVVSGWNVEMFDIPFLCNRIARVLGVEYARQLSPFGILEEKTVEWFGKENQTYVPVGISVLDYLQLYIKFSYIRAGQDSFKESNSLEYVANKELGESKIDYSAYDGLDDLYSKNPSLYYKYNVHDVVLVQRLDDVLKYFDLVFAIAYYAHANYNDAFTTVQLWDTIIYNYLMNKNIAIPKHKAKHQRSIVGGHVKESILGMHDWVVSFDLASLYPSIIMGMNISPETFYRKLDYVDVDNILESVKEGKKDGSLDDYCLTATGCLFNKEKQGFIPAVTQEVFDKRNIAKKQKLEAEKKYEKTQDKKDKDEISKHDGMQLALKIAGNGLYGAISNVGFRFYDADLAESITKTGQVAIRWIEHKMNNFLNNMLGTKDYDYVIHCDTDSALVRLDKLVDVAFRDKKPPKNKIIDFLDNVAKVKLEKEIEKWYDELSSYLSMYKKTLRMKREIIADKAIWVAKKRYIANVWDLEGVRFHEPKFKIKGIEAVRSDTPEVCRDAIIKTIKMIFDTNEDETRSFMRKFKEEFKTKTFAEISSPSRVNNLDKYHDAVSIYKKGCPIHVRAALLHNHYIKEYKIKDVPPLFSGQKIRYCYLKLPNPINENVIAGFETLPKGLDLEEYIDYDLQFEKTFLAPMEGILEVINWSFEKKSTLSSFFR